AYQYRATFARCQRCGNIASYIRRLYADEASWLSLFTGLRNGDRDFCQSIRYRARADRHATCHREERIIRSGVDKEDLGSTFSSLTQALSHQGVILAQEGTHDDHAVNFVEFCDRHTEPGRAGNGLIECSVCLTQTEVHVFAAQSTRESCQQGELFNRSHWAANGTELFRTDIFANHVDGLHHHLKRIAPGGLAPFTLVITDHGMQQAVFGVEAVIGEAIAIGDPAFVDVFVLEGHDTLDTVEFDLGNEVRAKAVVRTDGTATRQFPRPRRHLVGLGQQRPNRTEVDHVAGEFRLDRLTDKGGDLGKLAAVNHADFHDAADFFPEANAAGTVNAPLHAFCGNQGAHVLGHDYALLFLIAGSGFTVTHGQILQLALTALVTYGAVERVIDQ